jgi:hypothetical protein
MSMPTRGRIWRLHASLVVAGAICISAFVVELSRAVGGNALSWAYVFEWPLLLAYSFYLWHRLLRDERGEPSPTLREESPEDAEARAKWNEYLARLHASEAGEARSKEGG